MAKSVEQTLSLVREQIDVGARNLELAGDPNARRINTSLTIDQIGGSKAYRASLSESRSVNMMQEKAYIEQVTKLESNNTYTEFLTSLQSVVSLQSVISGENKTLESRFVKTIDAFFTQAKILEANNGPAMRQAFIDKAEEVSAVITGASEKVTDLRFEADKRLKQNTYTVNGTIKAIFNLNQQMLISSAPIRLHDKRDELIRELAHNFDIKASYGASGTVSVQMKNGELLVGNDYYSEFSYNGVESINAIIENNDYPPLMINQLSIDGKQIHSKVFIGGSNDATMSVSGGEWKALIDLRDTVLPAAGDKIKTLGRNFANKLNAIHNNGSPFPPQSRFESSIEVSQGQELEWGDQFTIHFLSKDGDRLNGGAGRLNPTTIDIKNMAGSALSGGATVADLIKELNEKLDLAPSRARAAIGGIADGTGTQLPGEYLLNNIQLRARGSVNPADNNSFTFDLDLQGNSHFDSNIEVLGVLTEDVGTGANQQIIDSAQLPGSFKLEKDTNIATGQNIKVSGATAGRVIKLALRVTGENGVVSEGTVSFPMQPAAVLNDRIAFDSTVNVNGGVTTGAFNPVPLTSHSGVARAKLVDNNGIEIAPNSGQSGKLVIETNDDSYSLVIQGGNFGSLFGFNDLFEFDERTGKLNVSQEIVDDVSKLSIGRVEKGLGVATAHTVGDAKAKATLVFAGALAANDNISINLPGWPAPVALTFVNALAVPNNPDEVLLGSGLFGVNGLVERINAHPQLIGLVVARNEGGNVTIEAKAAGTSGNAITVASALNASTVDINGNGAANNNAATNLNVGNGIAGTNKVEASNVFGYNMKPNNQQVLQDLSALQTELVTIAADSALPNTVATLSGLATIVTGLLSDTVNEAQIESDVAAIVLERTDAQIKRDSGINKEQEYLRVLDLARHMSTLSHLLSILQNTLVKTEDILFSR